MLKFYQPFSLQKNAKFPVRQPPDCRHKILRQLLWCEKGLQIFLARLHFSLSYFCRKVYSRLISSSQGLKPSMSTIYCFIEALPVQNICKDHLANFRLQSQLDPLKVWKSVLVIRNHCGGS